MKTRMKTSIKAKFKSSDILQLDINKYRFATLLVLKKLLYHKKYQKNGLKVSMFKIDDKTFHLVMIVTMSSFNLIVTRISLIQIDRTNLTYLNGH